MRKSESNRKDSSCSGRRSDRNIQYRGLAEGELLVRVGACGVCGSDLHIVDWELGAERMVARLPVILGHEPAGEVVEVGARVTNFKVGDRVALDPFGHCGRCGPCSAGRFHLCASPTTLSGAFAEFTVAPVGNAHLVPSTMNIETGRAA